MQPHYIKRPALDIFFIRLCDPRTKKFGDPWTNFSQDNGLRSHITPEEIF